MLLILDSNEYLFAFGVAQQPAPRALFDRLLAERGSHQIRLPRLILGEIQRNFPARIFREVAKLIQDFFHVDEDFLVPFELGSKYEQMGLKPADAFIGAYTEFVGADALVTENRHFLTRRTDLPFRVLTAEQCLKLL